jgi:hypothetical protein
MPEDIELHPKFPRQTPSEIERHMWIPIRDKWQAQPVIVNHADVQTRARGKIIVWIHAITMESLVVRMVLKSDHEKCKVVQRIAEKPVHFAQRKMRLVVLRWGGCLNPPHGIEFEPD